jgi:hypothetical protein
VWRGLSFLSARDAIGRLVENGLKLIGRLGIEEVAEHGQAIQPGINASLAAERMAFTMATGEAERAATCWIVTT